MEYHGDTDKVKGLIRAYFVDLQMFIPPLAL